jgi:hypothetical protein
MVRFAQSSLLLILTTFLLNAQSDSSAVKIKLFSANLGYGIDLPSGDLSKRFGQSLSFITGVEYLLDGTNSIGIDYVFNFGNKVKEDVFASFRNENGLLLGINGAPAISYYRQRGNYAGLNYSKLFKASNKTSGIKLSLGAGIMTHSIKVFDDSRSLVIAEAPYVKGFDRLTRGFALKQELVYQHHSKIKALHFNVGFNIMEGFTKQVRKVNFDNGQLNTASRLDLLFGIRLTWMIPLSKSIEGTINYY